MSKIDINDVLAFIYEIDTDYKKLKHCQTYDDCDECPSEDTCRILMRITYALQAVADARLKGDLK